MRIYIQAWQGQYFATAPELPGVMATGGSREAAAGACRALVEKELECYESLGVSLPVNGEITEFHDWGESGPAVYPEALQPATREFIRAVLRRTEHMRAALDNFLDELSPQQWEQHSEGAWNVRTLLDHIANSQWLIIQSLDPWPLDPLQAQEALLEELYSALITLSPRGRTRTTWHFGLNRENGRVCWTPRKVLRVVGAMQEGWLDHLENGQPEPPFPQGHENLPGDGTAPTDEEFKVLWARGRRLLSVSAENRAAAGRLAVLYRYYRNRLVMWPEEPRQRWESVWQLTRSRLLSLSDEELALVRVDPATLGYGSGYSTVRQALSLTLAHLREHFNQMKQIVQVKPSKEQRPER
jgi:predicted RNase H-like HicB family nuclease